MKHLLVHFTLLFTFTTAACINDASGSLESGHAFPEKARDAFPRDPAANLTSEIRALTHALTADVRFSDESGDQDDAGFVVGSTVTVHCDRDCIADCGNIDNAACAYTCCTVTVK